MAISRQSSAFTGVRSLPLFLPLALLLQVAPPPVLAPVLAPLPSARSCAALFGRTFDMLRARSGDPAMTQGFADDAAALRRIVIAQETGGDAAKADAAIATERTRLESAPEETLDLKPCYRVKALGRGGE